MKHILIIITFLFSTFCFGGKIERVEKLIRKGNSFLVNNEYGHQLSSEKYQKAFKYFNKAIKIQPDYPNAYNSRGMAYYYLSKKDSSNFQLAIQDFTIAINLDSSFAIAFGNRAMCYDELEKFKLSRLDYMRSIKLDSMNFNIFYNLGCHYNDLKEYENAIKAFSKSLQFNNESIFTYNNRAACYIAIQQFNEAKSDLLIVLESEPEHKTAINNLGLTYSKLEDFDSAIIQFEKGLTINEIPELNKIIFNNLANSYFQLNYIDRACENWHLAIKNGYDYDTSWKQKFNIEDPKELIKRYCN